MTPEALVALGALIVAVPVGLGILVAHWPRPDTRKRETPAPSVTDMVLRERLDKELHDQQRFDPKLSEAQRQHLAIFPHTDPSSIRTVEWPVHTSYLGKTLVRPHFSSGAPWLYGDGVHDDQSGLQALIDGEQIVLKFGEGTYPYEIVQRYDYDGQTYVRLPSKRTWRIGKMLDLKDVIVDFCGGYVDATSVKGVAIKGNNRYGVLQQMRNVYVEGRGCVGGGEDHVCVGAYAPIPRSYGEVVDEREPMRDEGDIL